jgi:exonuclease SbcD
MPTEIRILLLADSHLGFDLPARPRVARRRRGHDLLANYEAALAPALAGEVDMVVHGGDVFHRSRVAPVLAYQGLEPLARIAERGVPVFIVPGNHERSRLPHDRFVAQPLAHVFDRPRTFVTTVRGTRIALSGFPSERRDVRSRFGALLDGSDWRRARADVRLLCMHQCVEGATVGPGDFRFTTAADVVRCREVPADFAAVLSGHIHRHQVVTRDLRGGPLHTPVLYPGSLERISIAELDEPKGYLILRITTGDSRPVVQWDFRGLPARPMMVRDIQADALSAEALHAAVRAVIGEAPEDAVLRIRIAGELSSAQLRAISAARLREVVPESMNVDIRAGDARRFQPRRKRRHAGAEEPADLQLELG